MPQRAINDTCSRCGLCASTCPWRIITLPEGGLPRYLAGDSERCNLCGHCEAVCPAGAITIDAPKLVPSSPDGETAAMTPGHLGAYLRMRRSVRHYRQEPVERSIIEQLLDIVRYAPSGRNRQDVHWLIIHDTEELWRITEMAIDRMRATVDSGKPLAVRYNLAGMVKAWEEGRDYICHNAPHLVVAHVSEENPVARTNAIIALAHLDIIAPSFGLGTCWGGIFMQVLNSWKPLQEALDLPPGQMPVHCLMLGYPVIRYQRPPKRKSASIVWR